MKKTGIIVMVLALVLSAAPAVAVNVTLSDAGLMALDWYLYAPNSGTVVDRRDVPGPGVEFDIYYPSNEYPYNVVYYVSSEQGGAGSLAGLDISMYDAFELKYTLVSVDGVAGPGAGGYLVVGALIGKYDGSLYAYRPEVISFAPGWQRTAVSSTSVRTDVIYLIGIHAHMLTPTGWNPSGTTVTLLVEPVPGAVVIPEPAIIYVDADATGNNDGSSWADGFNDLQDALSAAWSGDEIWVAQGIYKPDEDSAHPNGTGSRTATFQLKNGVAIKGGYAGFGEPDPNDRNIEAYETILSGDLNGNDEPNFANNSENSYRVVTGSGTDETAVLDGFTITAGNANGPWQNHQNDGGGMYNHGSKPTLANCTFSGNSAEVGGGMANYYSSPTVTNCMFSGNLAIFGGGMYNRESSPTLTNCTFSENFATINHGGGIYNCDSSSPMLTGCIFSGNSARTGGGIMNFRSSPTLTDCTFSGNSASEYGGGMENNDNSNSTLTNCTFSGNSASNRGGGMYNCRDSSPILNNCTFSANLAQDRGGGMANDMESNPTVTNCIFSGNWTGFWGGGLSNWRSSPTLTNCTFTGNSAEGHGGGMNNSESDLILTNCTFSGNTARWDGGGMSNHESSTPTVTNCILWGNRAPNGSQIYNDGTSSASVSYSDVQGGWPGTGNINANPLFVDSAIGDYHLLPDSPCIDAGDNSAVPPSVLTDLDGKSRIINDTVDMGAYEFHRPGILYIDADATGANDGSSWANAYNYLQDALAFAWSGDEIRVAQGIYKPDKGGGNTPSDREATFRLKNGVAVKGGYAGFGEADPDARDIDAYETVLSGDLLGNDGPDFANNYENSYHVVTGSGTNVTAVLDGFTITAGNANQDYPSPYANGGGMYNYTGSPTLTNCTFSGNSAMHYGGGMFNGESSPTVTNCIFSGNSADYGSGMYNYQSSPTVTNCTFIGNSAETGGGMCNWENSSPTVGNCTFGGNSAVTYGGGMSNFDHSSPTVTNCTFSGNSAANYGHGGGMSNFDNSSPTVTNCTFSGNSAGWDGGGMFNYYSSPTLANCILWGNAASSGPQIHNYGTSSATVSYSDVQGGWPGEGNIEADPLFGTPGAWEPIEETDMVSYWKFDGNADDSAGDNDGTVYGAQWTIGQLGGALDFDGAGDYVDCGNDSSLNPTNNFSISAWFNVDSASLIGTIVCKGDVPAYQSGGAYTILCVPMNGTLGFYVRGSSNAGYGYAVTAVSVNEWTHVVGTFSDGNISIYKNGVFAANGVLGTSTINTNNGPLGIGAEGDGGTPFNGIIDDVAIHNRALSSEEIEQLYQIGLSGRSDYHLLPDSPCINAGDPNYVAEPNETDLDGKPRVIGGRIDMGAYEFNHIPIADAGPDREVGAWPNGIAEVTLDGSGSYDDDGQPLSYLWNWTVGGNTYTATGPTPTIELPVGEQTIELIVNDGIDDSEPDEVVITVIEPIEVAMKFTPQALNPDSKGNWVKAHFVLPEGFGVDDVDTNSPAKVEPLGIESEYINVFVNEDGLVEIEAAFGRAAFCGAATGSGPVEVTVVGLLTSGQYFYGTDTIKIINKTFEYLGVLASHWLEAGCGAPDWCGGLDLDHSSMVDFVDFAMFDGCCIEVIRQ